MHRTLEPEPCEQPGTFQRVPDQQGNLAAAITTLGLGPTQGDDVRRNARLRDLPTAPAERVYTGVLYDALGLTTLDAQIARVKRELATLAAARQDGRADCRAAGRDNNRAAG